MSTCGSEITWHEECSKPDSRNSPHFLSEALTLYILPTNDLRRWEKMAGVSSGGLAPAFCPRRRRPADMPPRAPPPTSHHKTVREQRCYQRQHPPMPEVCSEALWWEYSPLTWRSLGSRLPSGSRQSLGAQPRRARRAL